MNGGGGEIRLSIVGSGGRGIRKYPPVPPRVQMNARGGQHGRGGGNGSPVAAAIERRKQQVAAASDENDDDNDANVDDDDDDDDNHHRQQHHILVQKRQPSIVYKNFRDTFSCFSLGIFVWLSLLTLFIVYHLLYAAPAAAAAASSLARADALVPVIEAKKDHTRWDVPFTLVPDEGSLGRLMTLPLKQLVFDRLVRYDVCCFQQIYFSCRSATKNLGVECLIAKDRGALINVLHPDMVGARCVLMWSEKN